MELKTTDTEAAYLAACAVQEAAQARVSALGAAHPRDEAAYLEAWDAWCATKPAVLATKRALWIERGWAWRW